MLKIIGAKLWAMLAGVVLLVFVGYQRKVINKQSHDIKIKDKINKLSQESDEFESVNKTKEEKSNEENIQNINSIDINDKWDQL